MAAGGRRRSVPVAVGRGPGRARFRRHFVTNILLEYSLLASILAALYPILGYPLVLGVIAAFRPRLVRRAGITPTVSILIPAYNEADCIAATVENKLGQDYPADRLEITVVS